MGAVFLVSTVFFKHFTLAAPGTPVREYAKQVKSFLLLRHVAFILGAKVGNTDFGIEIQLNWEILELGNWEIEMAPRFK